MSSYRLHPLTPPHSGLQGVNLDKGEAGRRQGRDRRGLAWEVLGQSGKFLTPWAFKIVHNIILKQYNLTIYHMMLLDCRLSQGVETMKPCFETPEPSAQNPKLPLK